MSASGTAGGDELDEFVPGSELEAVDQTAGTVGQEHGGVYVGGRVLHPHLGYLCDRTAARSRRSLNRFAQLSCLPGGEVTSGRAGHRGCNRLVAGKRCLGPRKLAQCAEGVKRYVVVLGQGTSGRMDARISTESTERHDRHRSGLPITTLQAERQQLIDMTLGGRDGQRVADLPAGELVGFGPLDERVAEGMKPSGRAQGRARCPQEDRHRGALVER
jgi:hypothetical protein